MKPVWSFLYECEGEIYRCGPFDSEEQAMTWGKAEGVKEFNIFDSRVYLLHPDHQMQEIKPEDLGVDPMNNPYNAEPFY